MTFYLIDELNSMDNGLELNLGDHILVEYDGSIVESGNDALTLWVDTDGSNAVINGLLYGARYGINSVGVNNHITVNGLVMGDVIGISAFSSTTVHVGLNGQVSGATGVELQNFSNLVNDGTVNSWEDTAVKMANGDLINNGLISSYFDAISYGGEWLSSITNTGTIQGNLTTDDSALADTAQLFVDNSGHWHGSLELSPGFDRVINTGTITGGIHGGDGGDRIDSRNGSIFGDIFGDSGDDVIRAGAEDNVIGGGTGGDSLEGGDGVNTLYYGSSALGVRINLVNGSAKYGEAAGDTYSHFQNVTGSLSRDILIGDNGDNVLIGLVGDDVLTGNGGNDTLIVYGTGTAAIDGGDGNDLIQLNSLSLATYGSAFTAASRVNGGSGFDTLDLTNQGGAVVFGNQTVVNIERIIVHDGYNYDLTTRDATVAAGKLLDVDAGSLTAAHRLVFDGSAETNGTFDIDGGDGKDSFIAGTGADILAGGGEADLLTGGGGGDVFSYNAVTDSKGVHYDTISDLDTRFNSPSR